MEVTRFKAQSHYLRALIYGSSSSGKTTLASTAPNYVFVDAEHGLLSIEEQQPPLMRVDTMADLREALVYLKKGGHGFDTVIIDSISKINDIMKMEIETKNKRLMELQDWSELQQQMNGVVHAFCSLKMHVIFIALEQQEKEKVKKTGRTIPMLNGKAVTDLAAMMDVIAYVEAEKVDGEFTQYVTLSPSREYITKDRTKKLQDCTNPSIASWIDEIATINVGEQEHIATVVNGQVHKSGGLKPEQSVQIQKLWSEYWGLAMNAYPNQKSKAGNLIYTEKNSKPVFKQTLTRDYGATYLFELSEENAEQMISTLLDKIGQLNEQVIEAKKVAPKKPTTPVQPEDEEITEEDMEDPTLNHNTPQDDFE